MGGGNETENSISARTFPPNPNHYLYIHLSSSRAFHLTEILTLPRRFFFYCCQLWQHLILLTEKKHSAPLKNQRYSQAEAPGAAEQKGGVFLSKKRCWVKHFYRDSYFSSLHSVSIKKKKKKTLMLLRETLWAKGLRFYFYFFFSSGWVGRGGLVPPYKSAARRHTHQQHRRYLCYRHRLKRHMTPSLRQRMQLTKSSCLCSAGAGERGRRGGEWGRQRGMRVEDGERETQIFLFSVSTQKELKSKTSSSCHIYIHTHAFTIVPVKTQNSEQHICLCSPNDRQI